MTAHELTVHTTVAPLRDTRSRVRGPRLIPLLFFTMLVIAVFFAMIYLRIALDRNAFGRCNLQYRVDPSTFGL